jgi:hypothetical protein
MKAPAHGIHRSTAPWPMLFSLMCNGITPNRIGRRSQEVVEARLDNFVALARRFFKAGTIETSILPRTDLMRPAACSASEACVTARRLTPSILDMALCVYVKTRPSVHHMEPPGHPLLSCMHGIARDRLLNLSQQRLGIADEEVANVLASLEFRSQNLTRGAKRTALQLHESAIEGGAAYMDAKRPNAPSRPMFAVSIAAPFSGAVNNERTAPSGK